MANVADGSSADTILETCMVMGSNRVNIAKAPRHLVREEHSHGTRHRRLTIIFRRRFGSKRPCWFQTRIDGSPIILLQCAPQRKMASSSTRAVSARMLHAVLVFEELTEHASQEKIRRQEIKALAQEEGQQVPGEEEEPQVVVT